mgnify:FL=1
MKNKGMKLLLLAMAVAGLAGAAPVGVLADTTDEGMTSEAAIEETTETADTAKGGRNVPYYSLSKDGGNWDGSHYTKADGTLAKDVFFFDGENTYYLQADGSPMKDKLTYHPDGEHIIYFDTEGHEVFTTFRYCPGVGYTCYFDAQGYLYKDQITFVGDKVYYLNANGAMEQSGWFGFANGRDYGFANQDGTLITTGWGYDPYGRTVFYHWNGMVARGLISDASYYYSMDETDGHYLGQWAYNSIVVDGYAFDVDKMNAVSAASRNVDEYGYESLGMSYGNTVVDGIDYALVFNAQAYLNGNTDVKAAGFTTDNAILHFVKDGMPAGRGASHEFNPCYYRANYYDELNPKYGDDWKLYYYDYMCYGKSAGKVANKYITRKASRLAGHDFDYAALVRDYPEYR